MIRIKLTTAELHAAIDTQARNWRANAAATREHNRTAGKYDKATPSWSAIKAVYMALQHGKCAYCERLLAPSDPAARLQPERQPWRYAAHEFDVEHFRPKNAVAAWPPESLVEARGLDYGDLAISEGTQSVGYYLLSHEPLNYLASCKPCNSGLKSNYFPIAGEHDTELEDPDDWPSEDPYLIHPLGTLDDDPASLIEFIGVTPRPVVKRKGLHDYWRARITIDFFDLTHEALALERAHCIVTLYLALRLMTRFGPAEIEFEVARGVVAACTKETAPHSSCAGAFEKLYAADRPRAERLARAAAELVNRDAGE